MKSIRDEVGNTVHPTSIILGRDCGDRCFLPIVVPLEVYHRYWEFLGTQRDLIIEGSYEINKI
jgi:hypothetical protein